MNLFAIFWVLCSILTYGYSFGYFQREYPKLAKECYWEDLATSLLLSTVGPVGLMIHAAASYGPPFKHGLKFK